MRDAVVRFFDHNETWLAAAFQQGDAGGPLHGHYTETVDFVSGTDTYLGTVEIMNRPGTGVVVQDVGKAVFDADGNWSSSLATPSALPCLLATNCGARRWRRTTPARRTRTGVPAP